MNYVNIPPEARQQMIERMCSEAEATGKARASEPYSPEACGTPEPELKSLREIKAKLDSLAERLPTKLFAELASIDTPLQNISKELVLLEESQRNSMAAICKGLDELLGLLKGNESMAGLVQGTDNLFVLQSTNFAELRERLTTNHKELMEALPAIRKEFLDALVNAMDKVSGKVLALAKPAGRKRKAKR